MSISPIENADRQRASAIHLKHSARGGSTYKAKIGGGGAIGVLDAVKAPAYMTESEGAQKPLSHALALHRRQSGIGRRGLRAVCELETPNPQALFPLPSKVLDSQASLLRERQRSMAGAARGREICCSKAQLTLRSWRYGVCRETQQDRDSHLQLPI